jgi:hypothetical protein
MTTSEIKSANPQGEMSRISGKPNVISFKNVSFITESSKAANKLWNQLIKAGYSRCYNFSSDETDGIVQAGLLGQNPFAFTIISI